MKRFISYSAALVMVLLCLFGSVVSANAETVSRNPLVDPQEVETAKTPQRFTNILLLGIDLSTGNYKASGSWAKKELKDCHTDTVMVVSINMTTDEVNLISLPRDTLTYVPGVHGIYKLNGAFNCADTLDEGFERIRAAASWLLGGIKIDYYCAVDMAAMIALGDYIGGVDLDVEMTYTGHSGRKYTKGMQHLDGYGITDYLRARTNATVNGNDIGRTARNRQMMTAIFQKVKSNTSLIKSGWDYATSGELNFYTDMSLANVLNLLNKVKGADTIGSHVLTGVYKTALLDWNFTFTNQANRIAVIKEVYGIDTAQIPYVSFEYTKWLMEEGFTTVRTIAVARNILEKTQGNEALSEQQKAAVVRLENALAVTIQAFDDAADSMTDVDQGKMVSSRRDLRDVCNAVAVLLTGEEADWMSGNVWYVDPLINEYQYTWQ